MTPTYRADIDGLRAIAVLSVLLFHAGFDAFGGGYVGVDIFFVISGYLITTIIYREIESGSFSIAHFYERRFRRILPAVTVVILATLAAGAVLFHSHNYHALADSAVAATVFLSNVFFYLHAGYFSAPANSLPLLHTWSLAVEEQYYLFFPLLMIAISRYGARRFSAWLLLLAIVSFVIGVAVSESDTAAAFYLIHGRAWELFAGSLLATGLIPAIRHRHTRIVASLAGIAMLAFSIFAYTPSTVFPGIAAALPVIGTVLLIHSGTGGETFVTRCLRVRPLVFIGLISYSLYLWHWPVIVFVRHYAVTELTAVQSAAMLAATFVLSMASWRYVEKPFRVRRLCAERRDLFGGAFATSLAVLAIAIAIINTEGMPGRYDHELVMQFDPDDPEWHAWGRCENVTSMLRGGRDLCRLGDAFAQPGFVLWGDSHARALATAVDRSAQAHHVAGRIASEGGCPPLLDVVRPDMRFCAEFNDSVLRYIGRHPEIDTVILAARWALSTNGTRYKAETGHDVDLIDLRASPGESLSNARVVEAGLRRTLERLQAMGKSVVLVAPVPEIGYDVPSATFTSLRTGRDVEARIAPSYEEFSLRSRAAHAIIESVMDERPSLTMLDPATLLCDDWTCHVTVDNVPLYRDDNHLSTFGAIYLAHLFDDVFETKTNVPMAGVTH